MALFVFRLAGILTLEKAMQENFTSQILLATEDNLTNANSNFTEDYFSFFSTSLHNKNQNDTNWIIYNSQNQTDQMLESMWDKNISKSEGNKMRIYDFNSHSDNETELGKFSDIQESGLKSDQKHPANTQRGDTNGDDKFKRISDLGTHSLETKFKNNISLNISSSDIKSNVDLDSNFNSPLSESKIKDNIKRESNLSVHGNNEELGGALKITSSEGTNQDDKTKASLTTISLSNDTNDIRMQHADKISNAAFRSNKITTNPYPYGPRDFVPDIRTLQSNRNSAKEILEAFGGGNLKSDVASKDTESESEVKGSKENITKIIDEENKDEQPFSQTDEQFSFVTKEPTVLFLFDKPGGYTPKLPEDHLPPKRTPSPSDPSTCLSRCPMYSLLDWNPNYDVRFYSPTTWVSTVVIAENRILAQLEGYMRVQDYFYGLNDRGQLMNLTVPFLTQIQHGRSPGVIRETEDFAISLFVNHLDDPLHYDLPVPISNEVLVDHIESKTVFVVSFNANVWELTDEFLEEKALALMEKLRQNGEAFLSRYYYLASYSRPELYQQSKFELWVYASAYRNNRTPSMPLRPRKRLPTNRITQKTINKLCRGVECPPFEVLQTYRYGIQQRRYFDSLFATVPLKQCEFTTLSVWRGFMPLHLYKHGINSHMEIIEATRPIGLLHVNEDSFERSDCPQNMTMAIYLPKRLHGNPPLTGYEAPDVFISAIGNIVVYSYTVGGYILQPERVRKELSDLKYRLTEFGVCFKNNEYYVAVYDFIARYHGRQNEIWIVAENCKATHNG